jgi:molybdate transport system substrate-binding protein
MPRFSLARLAVVIPLAVLAILVLSSCGPKPAAVGNGASQTSAQASTAPAAAQTDLSVYIPCGIIMPMHDALDAFAKAHPEIKLKPFYDNPVGLARRIEQSPDSADVYIGPGPIEIGQLAKKGLVDMSTLTRFAQLQLVVLVPRANPAHIKKVQDLVRVSTFACPDPQYNSLGVMTQQSLTKLGLWDKLKSKRVEPEYAIDAYKLVASGKAEAGVTYRTCPLDSNPDKIAKSTVRIACYLPADSYNPDDCRFHAVITTSCKHRTEAAELLKWLASPEAGKIMEPLGLPMRHSSKVAENTAKPNVPAGPPKVSVVAFYPDTPGHADIKKLVLALNKKFPGQVKAEFVDFNSDSGIKRMEALNITCGCILINGKRAFDVKGADGKPRHIDFAREPGGEWQGPDLAMIVGQQVALAYGK